MNSISAARPYSWYRYLHKYGVEPVVVTRLYGGSSASLEDVLRDLPKDKEVKITRDAQGVLVQVPYRLSISEKMLMRFGRNRHSLIRRALTMISRMGSFISFRFDSSRDLYYTALKICRTERIDAIITSGEPFVLMRHGYVLQKKTGIPWIADYRDGWGLSHVTTHFSGLLERIMFGWEEIMEKRMVRHASLISTVDPLLAKRLEEYIGVKAETIMNGFDAFYESKQEPSKGLPLLLSHTGTLTPGQRVEFLLDAVLSLVQEAKIKEGDLVIQFVGLKFYEERWKRVWNYDTRLHPFLKTTERLSRAQSLELNAASDYLLNFSQKGYSAYYTKTYDYIAVQRPILVLPADNGLLDHLVRDLQAGRSFEQQEELKQFILDAVAQKKSGLGIAASQVDRQKAQFYLRESQAERLAKMLRKYFA